jgi:hypothetical protein
VRDAAGDGCDFSDAGRKWVKGFAQPLHAYRARRVACRTQSLAMTLRLATVTRSPDHGRLAGSGERLWRDAPHADGERDEAAGGDVVLGCS